MLLTQMSYRGCVLVINNMVAFMVWHKNPPKTQITSLQKIILDFFWSGHHWLELQHYHYRSEDRDSLGFFLNGPGLRCNETEKVFLQKMSYSKQLFLLKPKGELRYFMTKFYRCGRYSQYLQPPVDLSGMWLFEETLFYHDFLSTLTTKRQETKN